MQSKSFRFRDKKIVYKTYGSGSPVLLIHGFGEDGNLWRNQIDYLQKHFRLIVPDIPGSGESEFIETAGIETYAEIIKTLCDVEECTKLHSLIGHSMGGYITLAFAEKYPEYANSFGLFHSTAFPDTEDKKQTRRKAIEFIKENGSYPFFKTSIPGLFTEMFKEKNSLDINALIEESKKFFDKAVIQYYEAMIARPGRLDVLKKFKGPILFIIGEKDPAVSFESSLQQCHLPIQAHVNILRQSAHMGMWEEADKSNKILGNFLALI